MRVECIDPIYIKHNHPMGFKGYCNMVNFTLLVTLPIYVEYSRSVKS